MIKVLTVIGTRPEVIKMAPVIKALENSPMVQSFVCTTSQHRQMQDQMMALFDLKADFDLNLMKPGQSLMDITVGVLQGLQKIFQKQQFDWVLVQGDTTTSMAASMAASYVDVPVAHIEAGLRTHDLKKPYPEELNRQLTARMATKHFAPTEQAKQNLLQEHVPPENIIVTGNTVIDSLFYMRDKINKGKIKVELPDEIGKLIAQKQPYVLITGHRRESFGEGFLNICEAIKTLAERYVNWCFVYPVHLNPNVQTPVNRILHGLSNVHLIAPVDYAPFIFLMDHARIILTDSGGVQEEAPSLGKPVLVMREKTERSEGVCAGTAKLVGNHSENIINAVNELIENQTVYQVMAKAVNPYGDGNAASRIVSEL